MQDISSTHRDSILYQAALAKPVWDLADLAVEVMDMVEMGALKDQKINVLSKPEFN